MTDIRELDPQTVERIAAGEVVERPASVVKELVENAIDAGADRIDVAVAAGGTDSIRVADDGIGMTEREARRAVRQHTTSKLSDVDELERGTGTLGFRGEALHAVGAVSRLTVRTRPNPERRDDGTDGRNGGDTAQGAAAGTELTVEGGDVTDVEPAGCPPGTVVEVADLFYNVPARRKYLKRESTEFGHVSNVVTSYALANPDVAVSLRHDGRETFATTGQGDRRGAVMAVYGREVAEAMRPVEAAPPPADGPLDGVRGLVSHPETTRSTREYLSTFVNGRYVTASAVRDAVVEAYGSQLGPDRYPFAVLDLSVDPGAVDVNVHPRKLEVRFAEEGAVREQVRTAVADALREHGLLRSSAPRGRSAPEQTTIDPKPPGGASDDPDGQGAQGDRDGQGDRDPPVDAADGAGPDREATDTGADTDADTGTGGPDAAEAADAHGTATDGPSAGGAGPAAGVASDSAERPGADDEPAGDDPAAPDSTGTASPSSRDRSRNTDQPAGGTDTQTTLVGETAHPRRAYDDLPDLRVLGQLQDTYVVAEAEDGLVLIDQHAADERVHYERLRERFDGETTTQALAEPVRLELTAREAELFDAYEAALARLGFRASTDGRTVEVTTVPALVADAAGPALIRDALGELIAGGDPGEPGGTVEAVADELLADLACYPSVTGNTSLTDGSVVDLLAALDGCENPWACPHGRPVLIHVDSAEIEDRFERDYPGHGH